MNDPLDNETVTQNSVPLKIIFLSMLQAVLVPFGLFFLLIGLLFVFLTGVPTTIKHLPFVFGAATEQTIGKIEFTGETNGRESGMRVYRILYTYTVGQKYYTGIAFHTGKIPSDNQKGYPIRYLKDSPDISQLIGFRSTEASLPILIIVLVFLLVGIVIFTIGIDTTIKTLRIFKFGKRTKATVISVESTNLSINRNSLFKITFQFTNHMDETVDASTRSIYPELFRKDSEHEILYNTKNPKQILTIEDQSSAVKEWIQQNVT